MNKTTSYTPISKLANTTAYYPTIFILGLFTAVGDPALPRLAKNTSSTLDQISLFFVLGVLGYLLGSSYGGRTQPTPCGKGPSE